jgi:hypothetical protein
VIQKIYNEEMGVPDPILRVTISDVDLKLSKLLAAFNEGINPSTELKIPPNVLPGTPPHSFYLFFPPVPSLIF